MQHYEQDKAIEFMGLFNEISRKIGNLEKVGINVSEERESIENIKKSCDSNSQGATQMEAEIIYQEGIASLKEVLERLKEHDIYYSSYNHAELIQSQLDKSKLDEERIALFAKSTLVLLNQIQASDTRSYDSEKAVVEKIYGLAYNTIKIELVSKGRSIVLDWVKDDKIASSFINKLIEVDLALFDEAIVSNDIIRETLSAIKASDATCSYLNEGLILFIAMQDPNNIKRVETSLLDIIKEMTASDEALKNVTNSNHEIKSLIDELKNTIKKSRIYKELALLMSLAVLLTGLKYGSSKLISTIGHKEYKTSVDYFSNVEGKEAPVYPEYMPEIKNFKETTLTAYDVWRQENIFYGDYYRDIVTYDLSNIDLTSLEDFLEYDFSTLSTSSQTTETTEELDANELYNKAIIEIVRLTQDENKANFIPNEEMQETFKIILAVALTILSFLGFGLTIHSILKKLSNSRETKIMRLEKVEEYKKGLESYKRLCAENTEFKNRFLEIYQIVSQYIKNSQINEQYQRILTPNCSEESKKGEE